VDKDMDETIIIEMAAENPPKTPNGQRYCQKIVESIGIGICIQTFPSKGCCRPKQLGRRKY
jgi:hypothetical protein